MYSTGAWDHYSPWFAGSGSVSSQPQHEGENKKPEAGGTWCKEKNAEGRRDSLMALSTQFLTPPQPRVCPEDGWAEVRLAERTAAAAIWVPFTCSFITQARISSSCCGYGGKVRTLLFFCFHLRAIVSSRSFSHSLGSSSKKSHLTVGRGGWRTLLVRAEEAQTRTILWNALRLDLSNSHFSYCLLFFLYKLQDCLERWCLAGKWCQCLWLAWCRNTWKRWEYPMHWLRLILGGRKTPGSLWPLWQSW